MSDLLTTDDIIARYQVERHTAASIMRQLPSFKVGKRLFVRADDLIEWERKRTVYPVIKRRAIWK